MKRKPAGRRTVALFQIWVPVSVAAAACGLAAGCTVTAAPVAAERPAAGAPFVYVTGKGGPNEISQFASLGSGALRPLTPKHVASGEFPYDIAVSPQGTSAYAVDNPAKGGAVSQYTISLASGKLTPKSPRTVAAAGRPSGIIAISPDGRNAYVTSEHKGVLSQFAISPVTGKITPLGPATVAAPPDGSLGVAVTPVRANGRPCWSPASSGEKVR